MSANPSSRWLLPSLLLGVYLFLKLQGWVYSHRAADLERQLEGLRPTLSAQVFQEQMERTRQTYQQASAKVQTLDLRGAELLVWLTQHLPPSVTLRRLHLRSDTELRIQGELRPGIRDPEEVLIQWAQGLRNIEPSIRIWSLTPALETPGTWSFELEGRR